MRLRDIAWKILLNVTHRLSPFSSAYHRVPVCGGAKNREKSPFSIKILTPYKIFWSKNFQKYSKMALPPEITLVSEFTLYMPKTLLVIPNHVCPGARDPRTRIDRSRTTEEGELGPFRVRNNAKKLPAGPDQKKTKKITDQLGPSGPRTKRSLDSCLECPFGDGPVKAWIDSKL